MIEKKKNIYMFEIVEIFVRIKLYYCWPSYRVFAGCKFVTTDINCSKLDSRQNATVVGVGPRPSI